MVAITIKNIPEDIYVALKVAATAHHRSINGQLIACLEQALRPIKITPQETLARARALRMTIDHEVSQDEIDNAKHDGRA